MTPSRRFGWQYGWQYRGGAPTAAKWRSTPASPRDDSVVAGRANFANRTMWTRDNLDVLRGLNSESIDLVYTDPPFNSNKNYEA